MLSHEEREKAAELYSLVDEAAAEKIDGMVAHDSWEVTSTLPAQISAELKDSLRTGWRRENYLKVVVRVWEQNACNAAATWTFFLRR